MVAALFFHIGIELGTDSFVAPRAQMGTIEYACLWAVSLTIALVGARGAATRPDPCRRLRARRSTAHRRTHRDAHARAVCHDQA